jgi:membrane protease subunit HflC
MAEHAKERSATGIATTVVLAFVVIVGLLTWMMFFRVEFTEYVLVQTFGKTTAVLDGQTEAGLHFKWPFVQKLVRYDARTFVFEDAMSELSTNDKQNVILTTFCAWRIRDPLKFQTAIRTVKEGQNGIRTKLRAAKGAVIGRRTMADLVNTDPGKMQIEAIEQEILTPVRTEALNDYGVEVIRVGIKSLGLPEAVSNKVIEAMKDERQKEVARFEEAGKAQAQAIRERARAASRQIIAFAERKAGEIRAEGDRAAAKWYRLFEQNWQFAAYLRTLRSLQKELQDRAVILLDGSTLFGVRYFRDGPSLPTKVPGAAPATPPKRKGGGSEVPSPRPAGPSE